jgi:hypothetical protein
MRNEVNDLLKLLSKNLDISDEQYKAAKISYEAVGNWLSEESSPLYKFKPNVKPQGSFMIGTMIKPINEEDDIDVDLVCNLEGKPDDWTQEDVKEAVGNRLKSSLRYNPMIKEREGGRRCWTLKYNDKSNYHLDVLPSVSDENLKNYLNESFSFDEEILDVDKYAIRITDKEESNYSIEDNVDNWKKSNPFGYAKWFFSKAIHSKTKLFSLNESVDPLRELDEEKLPLQRVVQLLKRHRDIMFSDEEYNIENKPISIIITTLSSKTYDKSENIVDAYINIVRSMRGMIEKRINYETGSFEYWVANPVNEKENFADKWGETPQKKDYFFLWLDRLELDINDIINSEKVGFYNLNESFSRQFGSSVSKKTFTDYGNQSRILTESSKRKMLSGVGLLGDEGVPVPKHNFEGK